MASAAIGANAESGILKFAPEEGETRMIRLHVVANSTGVSPGSKTVTVQTLTLDSDYRVLAPSSEERLRVEITTRRVRVSYTHDGRPFATYDSASPNNPSNNKIIGGFEGSLLGLNIILQLNADGSIESVENKKEVGEQFLTKMQPEDQKYARPLLEGSLGDNIFRNYGNTFASFSAGAVRVGDSWPKRDAVSHDSNLIYDGQVTLAKTDGNTSTLHLKSIIRPDPNRPTRSTFRPLTGAQKGYYFVDNATGWPRRGRLEQRWAGRTDEHGAFVPVRTPDSNALYMKLTFDFAVIEE